MKAIRLHAHGGPEVLRLDDLALPEPGPGQVRVRLVASGVNFIDVYHRLGVYKISLPFTPGQEGAGHVEALGAGVTSLAVGDRVAFAFSGGAYAEAVLVPADKLARVPEQVDLSLAAAVMLQGCTAHYLACDTFPLGPGHTAVVHAAAGATGALLVQIARLRGARVLATASSEARRAMARAAGADEVLPYEGFSDAVRALTNGRGADVVYDSVGRDTFAGSLDALRPRGMLVLYGQSSGVIGALDPLVLMNKGSLFLTRPSLGAYLRDHAELQARAGDLFAWMAAGRLTVRVDRRLPLAEAGAGQAALENRQTAGKVLLLP
ncbi:MAG: quinone oxidoreductase [Thermoflexales bacterium]|nr:quinone oxidoreductase [Thermoflexales bacterium]